MMSIEQITQDLDKGIDVQVRINDLGTALRDPEARSLDLIRSAIPTVLGFVSEYPMEVLRALVNYTANDDDNRCYMLSDASDVCRFWESDAISASFQNGITEVQSRLMILVTQFVRAAETKQAELLGGLERRKVIGWVWAYYKACVSVDMESIDGPSEVLAAYTQEFPRSLSDEQIELILKGLESTFDMSSDEETEDIALSHTLILVNATSVDDSALKIPAGRLLACIAKVPNDYKNVASLKRNLFAACGGIFSFSSFDNFSIVEANVTTIINGRDGYAIAAAAISLGNCVRDVSSQEQLLQRIEAIVPISQVAQAVLKFPFSDVVQLQAFHFFNNCMTEALAVDILQPSNEANLYKNTKIVVDNYKYYKEIGTIYLKFLGKLISLGYLRDHQIDVTELNSVWEYLGTLEEYCDVQMLLLQVYSSQKKVCDNLSPSIVSLLDKLLLIKSSSLEATELLMNLKTLAIFLQNADPAAFEKSYPETEFESSFLSKLELFFAQLLLILQEKPTDQATQLAHAVITNNTQFVAAAASKFYATFEKDFPNRICNIRGTCANILRTPHILAQKAL